jgi:hypothetical protein
MSFHCALYETFEHSVVMGEAVSIRNDWHFLHCVFHVLLEKQLDVIFFPL